MAQGDVPTPRGSAFKRRKEKRQLEQLAHAAKRDAGAPKAAATHVRVIEDQLDPVIDNNAEVTDLDVESQEPASPNDGVLRPRSGGFHVRPVPIDQPVGD